MDQMLRIGRVFWLHITGVHARKKNLRVPVIQNDLHDLLTELPVNDMFIDNLTLIHNQSTVLADIGNLILHTVEQPVKIRILAAAGCGKNPALLRQLMNELCGAGI